MIYIPHLKTGRLIGCRAVSISQKKGKTMAIMIITIKQDLTSGTGTTSTTFTEKTSIPISIATPVVIVTLTSTTTNLMKGTAIE